MPIFSQNDTLHQIEVNATVTPGKSYKIINVPIENVSASANLGDLISKETPIYIKSYGGGSLSTISIRGTGASHTQLYWNGIPINSPTLGQLDLAVLPVTFIDEVEIHLGASSVVDGSGGLGGAIQLNNSANYNTKLNVTLNKELGSFGLNSESVSFNIGNKKIQSKTSLFKNYADNNFRYIDISQAERPLLERENSAVTQYGIKQDIYFKPNDKHEFSIKTNYIDSYRQIASIIGVPSKKEYQTDQILRLLGEWKYIADKSFHHLRLAFVEDKLNYVDTSAAINSFVKINSYKGYYNWKYFFTDSIQIMAQVSAGVDLANSSGFNAAKQQNREALFIQFEQKSSIGILYSIAIRQEIIDGNFAPIVPTVGGKYFISKKWNVNLNAARNFKAPSLNELYWNPGGNKNLLSEIGCTTELGFNYTAKSFEFSISPYYSLIDNWIQWTPLASGIWSPINIKQVENKGIELNLKKRVQLSKNTTFSIQSGYNYVISTNIASQIEGDNSVGKQLIYVPKHNLNLVAQLHYKKWKIEYSQSVTGNVFIDATNLTYMPYYAPATFKIAQISTDKLKQKSLEFGFKIENLFNEDYQIIANRPLPKRWFSFFLKVNLFVKNA